jgi:hypothetical protein
MMRYGLTTSSRSSVARSPVCGFQLTIASGLGLLDVEVGQAVIGREAEGGFDALADGLVVDQLPAVATAFAW